MNYSYLSRRALWVLCGLIVSSTLMSCSKSEKQSTAGGGSSTQSIMSVKGAAR